MEMSKQEYQKYVQDRAQTSPLAKDCLLAFVIGGGICKEGEPFFAPIRERTYPQTFNHDPNNCAAILQAKLGNDAGIIGAALLGKQFQHI